MEFKDHFSDHAVDYARYRPDYPATLYEYPAKTVRQRKAVWDGGTGNGQAARGFAAHFDRVITTDPSAEQIHDTVPYEKITYVVAAAEQSGIPSARRISSRSHRRCTGSTWGGSIRRRGAY